MAPHSLQRPELRGEAARLRSLLRAVRNSSVCVLYQTPTLLYAWGENIPALWQDSWKVGGTDLSFLPDHAAGRLEVAKKQVLDDGTPRTVELAVNEGRETRWFEFYIDCDREENDKILGIVTTVLEVSELKRREQVLTTLLREVSHRSKNLLSIIQSIALQTAKFTGSVDEFLLKFRGRIQSLSHSQDLVTDSNWRGALFRDLVRSQLERYADIGDARLTVTGDNPYLFPGPALHLGLALHELVVNATSHGGLSHHEGTVTISAKINQAETGVESLEFVWIETDIGTEEEPNQTNPRFGSAVLQRIVPASVNGTAHYQRDASGVTYRLTLSDDQFDS